MSHRRFILSLVLACLFACNMPAIAVDGAAPLSSGIYLVTRESDDQAKLQPVSKDEFLIISDDRFLDPSERGPARFLTVSVKDRIPIVITNSPEKGKDGKGRPSLLLELDKSQVKPLEEFTTKHVNKSVAIVIGGDVVTVHKIREPIKGGKLQITRCTDNGCEVLYSKLTGDTP